MNTSLDQVTINGKTYVLEGSVKPEAIPGKRAVIVVDRGWIFAGDVTEENGRIKLTRAVWVFRWESIGLDGVIKNPKSDKATIKKLDTIVDIPSDAEVFRFPVSDDWGLG